MGSFIVGMFLLGQFANAHIPEREFPFSVAGVPSIGNEDAEIKVALLIDLECPFSADTMRITVPQLLKAYPDQIRFYIRHYALPVRPLGDQASVAGACANEQGRYWQFHKLFTGRIFPTEKVNILDPRGEGDLKLLKMIARRMAKEKSEELGDPNDSEKFDENEFLECIASPQILEQIQDEKKEIENVAGFVATPTYWFGKDKVEGNRIELVKEKLEELGLIEQK